MDAAQCLALNVPYYIPLDDLRCQLVMNSSVRIAVARALPHFQSDWTLVKTSWGLTTITDHFGSLIAYDYNYRVLKWLGGILDVEFVARRLNGDICIDATAEGITYPKLVFREEVLPVGCLVGVARRSSIMSSTMQLFDGGVLTLRPFSHDRTLVSVGKFSVNLHFKEVGALITMLVSEIGKNATIESVDQGCQDRCIGGICQ